MRYIKWIYLAIWALIYQLPIKSIIVFSSCIVSGLIVLFFGLLTSPEFIVGTVGDIYHLPGDQNTVLEITFPLSSTPKLALIDTQDLQPDIEKALWLLGYGKESLSFGSRSILQLDSHTTFSLITLLNEDDLSLAFNSLAQHPKIALIGGIALLLLGRVVLQGLSGVLLGTASVVLCWHLIYIGNFLDLWFLNHFIILPLSLTAGVAGAAIGMRTDHGLVSLFLQRISSTALLLLFLPLLADQLSFNISLYHLFGGALLAILFPSVGLIAGSASLVSYSLSLNPSESVAILILTFFIVLWINGSRQTFSTHRPFRNLTANRHGEIHLNTIFKGAIS